MGRILALDYGRKRIGVSISDETKTIAQILTPPITKTPKFKGEISRLADRFGIEKIIVGLPKSLSVHSGPMENEAKEFIDALREYLSIPIEPVDERFTSEEAGRRLAAESASRADRKVLKDNLSAQILLQQYLEVLPGKK